MATRAVSVVVERSPSGLHGVHCQVGDLHRQAWEEFHALAWVRCCLVRLGADQEERARVVNLIMSELGPRGRRRAIVTAEVSS